MSNVISSFESLKIALTEFRMSQGDLRKINASRPAESWVELQMPDSAALKHTRDKVQVLMCLDSTALNLPLGGKFGILYDGLYNEQQLSWQCSFVADTSVGAKLEDLMLLLPASCRQQVVSDMLVCDW